MDDQQMDQWFGDKLRQEQEFDFRESDWEAVADGLDQQEKRRRRRGWLWWPIGLAAAMILGLVFWQQQKQINTLHEHLSELQSTDTIRKTVVITDTVRNTVFIPNHNAQHTPRTAEQNAGLAGMAINNTNTQSDNIENSATTEKAATSAPKHTAIIQANNTISKDVLHNISNSSVVEDRAQFSAVDSLTEPTVFLGDPDYYRERVEKLEIYFTELTQPLPDISEVVIRKNSVKKIKPKRQWKPKFELDLAGGFGKPRSLSVDLTSQGKLNSNLIGAGFSVQPIKRWWIRAGISRQVVRYSTTEPSTANAYADSQRNALEEILDQRDSSQFAGLLNKDLSSLKDQNRYWQYELGLRYDWLNRKKWNLYLRGDILAKMKQQRKTEFASFDLAGQYTGVDPENESLSGSSRDFSITGIQLGLGGNYHLNRHWQLSLEGTTHINNNGSNLAADLIPLWDIRLGARYRF